MRRSPLLVLLVAACTASALVVGGAPAQAAAQTVSEVHDRPSDGTFSVEGRGWGHGRGMSQWGAQGAATLGRTADEITAAYYPGTAKGALADAPVRVWISEDDERDVVVQPASGLRVSDAATGRSAVLPAARTRATVVGGTALQVSTLTGATWTPLPGFERVAGPVRFGGPATTRVLLPSGASRDYRGTVTAVRTGSSLKTVVVLGLEDYLLGVVPREAAASWAPAALQAQAIAARSYSAYKRARVRDGADYDICETTACQVFGGTRLVTAAGKVTELEPASTTAAVRATRGVVRTWQGAPIFAEFSSSNGGWSTQGDFGYLVPREDPWDGVTRSHVHSWTATLTVAQIEKRFPSIGTFRRLRVTGRDGNGAWGGRVRSVVLEGSKGTATTTGAGIYTAAAWPGVPGGLRSSWWRITDAASSSPSAPQPAPQPSSPPPAVASTPLTSRTVQQSLTPTLWRPPGASTGEVSVAVENTGRAAWPVRGLHLTSGTGDALAPRGAFVGNRTRPGADAVEPGEVATFRVPLDARRTPAGSHPRSFRLRVDDGPLFGTAVTWPLRVVAPRLTAARLTTPPTVVLPKDGAVTVPVTYRNTGDLTWPAGVVALGTSVPRNRASASSGAGWESATRASRVRADVAPGASTTVDLVLHGNGRTGTSVERVEPLWSGGGWLEGAVTSVNVVRTDPSAARLTALHSAPRALVVPRGREATVVLRLRNLGGQAWSVGREAVSTHVAHPLRTSRWLGITRPPALAGNASRPGATTVEPGEIGEWRVPFRGARAGTFPTVLQAVGPGGVHGPRVGVTLTVR